MPRLPQPDQAGLFAEYRSVVPPPDHRRQAVLRGCDGHQVPGRHAPVRGDGNGAANRTDDRCPLLRMIWQASS